MHNLKRHLARINNNGQFLKDQIQKNALLEKQNNVRVELTDLINRIQTN